MGKLSTSIQKLRGDERGNAIVIVAATVPLLFGAAALGIDSIQLSLAKRQLQRSADSAALAGAHARAQSKPAQAAALRALALGEQVALSTTAIVNSAPLTGAYIGKTDAVEVRLRTSPEVKFISMFTGGPVVIDARAVATKVGSTPACIIALHPTADKALEMTGNYQLSSGCGIASNSNDSDQSIRITGNFRLAGDSEISAVGGIDVSGNATVPATSQRFPNSAATADPFASVASPARITSCTASRTNVNLGSGTHTLQPGNYCGTFNIDGSANVTFAAGTYNMATEYMKINGGTGSTVSGTGVSIVLTRHSNSTDKWASMDWNGDTVINLSAPTVASGSAMAGILVMQDRNTPNNQINQINGNLRMTLRGALYYPNNELKWNGNVITTAQCLRIIGRVLGFDGNPGVSNNCTSDDGVMSAAMIKRVRLVE